MDEELRKVRRKPFVAFRGSLMKAQEDRIFAKWKINHPNKYASKQLVILIISLEKSLFTMGLKLKIATNELVNNIKQSTKMFVLP